MTIQSALQHDDYRTVLRFAYDTRRNHNPKYSLRSFARDLKLSSSQLSLVLNGKKGISPAIAARISQQIGLTGAEQKRFQDLVESRHGRSFATRRCATQRLAKKTDSLTKKEVEETVFTVMSDWYYSAILELCKIQTQNWTAQRLAQRLGLSEIQVDLALSKLSKLGMITRLEDGYRPAQDCVHYVDNVPAQAVRKFHAQVMNKASDAIHQQPVDRRYFRTELFPVRLDDLPAAQKDIRDFFEQFVKKYSNAADGKTVYSLGIQYFQIDRGEP